MPFVQWITHHLFSHDCTGLLVYSTVQYVGVYGAAGNRSHSHSVKERFKLNV